MMAFPFAEHLCLLVNAMELDNSDDIHIGRHAEIHNNTFYPFPLQLIAIRPTAAQIARSRLVETCWPQLRPASQATRAPLCLCKNARSSPMIPYDSSDRQWKSFSGRPPRLERRTPAFHIPPSLSPSLHPYHTTTIPPDTSAQNHLHHRPRPEPA